MSKWSRLSTENLFSCAYFSLEHDRYRLPNGADADYYYVHTHGSTMVVPRLNDGRLVLTRQYRYLLKETSIEFPAGGLKAGTTPLANAQAELEEEAGYRANSWREIGKFAPYKGVADEFCTVFLAEDLIPCPTRPEETEEFLDIFSLPPSDVADLIRSGEMNDGMSLAAFTLYEGLRPEEHD